MRLELEIGLRKLKGVHAHVLWPMEVDVLWDHLEPLYAKSVEESMGMVTLEHIKEQLSEGQYIAAVLMDGDQLEAAFAASVVEYCTYRSLRIIAAGGRRLREAIDHLNVLEIWALTKECSEIEAWCRPVMVRALRRKFKPKFTCVSYDLRGKMQ